MQTEHNLRQAAQLNMREEFRENNDATISSNHWRNKAALNVRDYRLVLDKLIARSARLESLKDSMRGRFMQVGAEYSVGLRCDDAR